MDNSKKRRIFDFFVLSIALVAMYSGLAYPDIYLRKTGSVHPQARGIVWSVLIGALAAVIIINLIGNRLFGKVEKPSPEQQTFSFSSFLRTFINLEILRVLQNRSGMIAANAQKGTITSATAVTDIITLWSAGLVAAMVIICMFDMWDKKKVDKYE